MHGFPPLVDGGRQWRMPLAWHLISELVACLVEDDLEHRGAWLEQLVAREPALAIWTVCRRGDQGTIGSLPELADWLAQHAERELVWSDGEWSGSQAADQSSTWAEMSAAGVAVSRFAGQLARADKASPKVQRQAAVLGLLHGTRDWLDSSRVMGEPGRGGVPKWLGRRLDQLEQTDRRKQDVAVRYVARAIAAQDDPRSVGSDETEFAVGLRRDVTRVHRLWLAEPERDDAGAVVDLGQVVRKLSRLQTLEDRFAETLQHEKLESLRQLAYGASHEINNPLANISTRAQALLRDESDPERRRKLATINSQALRAHEMISDLMLFARPPALEPRRLDLRPLLGEVLHELADEAATQQTELVLEPSADPVWVRGDPVQLAAVVKCLCINSLEALVEGGSVEVRAATGVDNPLTAPAPGGGSEGQPDVLARIEVRDTGPGIPPEVRNHLFDPFYSGREAGRGLGFGLAKAWRVVTAHQGQIVVLSEDRGTTMTVLLPADNRDAVETPSEASAGT